MLLLNLLLAIAWLALTGQFTAENFVVGMGLGFLTLWGSQQVAGPRNYIRRITRLVDFSVFYIKELIESNLRVAWFVLSPRLRMRPGIVSVPLNELSDFEITLLTSLITLTPGSLTLDISADRRTLYVHAIDIQDLDDYRQQIKQFERRVQELFA